MPSGAVERVNDWWDAFMRGAEAAVREAARDILEASKPIIAKEAIDRGSLLHSVEAADSVLRVSRLHYRAVWSAAHAEFVNYGTGPGHHPDPRSNYTPPFDAILAWVKRNARIAASVTVQASEEYDLGGVEVVTGDDSAILKPRRVKGVRLRKVPDAAARQLARAIQRKIYLKGTEPVLFAERARDEVMAGFDAVLEENIRRELAEWGRRGRTGAS